MINDILAAREKTHGHFLVVAKLSQLIKRHLPSGASPEITEAFDHIAVKLARICHGDPNEKDHWIDIIGYATLALRSIEDLEKERVK